MQRGHCGTFVGRNLILICSSQVSRFKRLRQKHAEDEPAEGAGFFSDEDADDAEGAYDKRKNRRDSMLGRNRDEGYDDDDLDDFVIADAEDEEGETLGGEEKQRQKAAKAAKRHAQARKERQLKQSETLGVDAEELQNVNEIIGDLSAYQWALSKDTAPEEYGAPAEEEVAPVRLDQVGDFNPLSQR